MELGRLLVIHSKDPSVRYLSGLYSGLDNVTVLDETYSDEDIISYLTSDEYDTIMMLGHGSYYGLFAPTFKNGIYEQFGRLIISDDHAKYLKGKKCVAIWCNANQFAIRHGLSGLFSGMVISELVEAEMLRIPVENQEKMSEHNNFWLSSLNECVTSYGVEEIPNKMSSYINDRKMTEVENFNFNSLYYLINGEEKYV